MVIPNRTLSSNEKMFLIWGNSIIQMKNGELEKPGMSFKIEARKKI